MQEIKKINLGFTINSGQVFLWDKLDDVWYGVNGSEVLRVSQSPFTVASSHRNSNDIFRQNDNLEKILKSISNDNIVRSAVLRFPGLRLMRQDPFQCYISFICSSNSSIPNIKQMLQRICKKFGDKVNFYGHEFFNFPQAEKLANASLKDLRMCGLGFRAEFVKKASLA
ncbi:MAG: DNA-3-methyladenine glycosylase family protein, partial [Nitrosopumilaceae archaeon]